MNMLIFLAGDVGGTAAPADLLHLQQEVARLREDLDQLKRQHDKRIANLVAELDEEKKTRLNLQVEIDRLKKRLAE
jgi:septal ring factor EnvC (AmiA/AmiB activator)